LLRRLYGGRQCSDDDINLEADQLRGFLWKENTVALGRTNLQTNVLPIRVPELAERAAEGPQKDLRLWIASEQDANNWHLCCLRVHGERVQDGGAAAQRNELAPLHVLP
jgi:hypothetical protein